MNFDYKITEKTDANIVAMSGQLIESHQGEEMIDDVENLILKDSNMFMLDLTGMTYINQTGMDILISLLTKSRIAGGECLVSGISAELTTSEEYERLKEIFSITTDKHEMVPVLK